MCIYICKYIHIIHCIIDLMFFVVSDQVLWATFWGTQVLCWNPGVTSPPPSFGNRRTKLLICQINHQILNEKRNFFSFLFEQAVVKSISLTETCVVMALMLWMSTNTSVYVSSGSHRLEPHKSPPWLSPDDYVMYKLRFVTICELSLCLLCIFSYFPHMLIFFILLFSLSCFDWSCFLTCLWNCGLNVSSYVSL
jgi:hypothetical protein